MDLVYVTGRPGTSPDAAMSDRLPRPAPRISCYTDFVRNVTIALDDETARWARIEAARQDMSVSRLVGGLIREQMTRESRYERARRSYLAQPPTDISSRSGSYPSREEMHRR